MRGFAARAQFRQASGLRLARSDSVLPIPVSLRSRRCLALAILLALPLPALAEDAPGCPVGVIKCPPKPLSWAMCMKSDLLDFHIPGLPTEGDRSRVAQDISAQKVSSPDKSHYVLEGQAEIRQLDLVLRADKLTYDTDTTDYAVEGHVRYQDRALLMSADRASGNTDLDQCTLTRRALPVAERTRQRRRPGRGDGRHRARAPRRRALFHLRPQGPAMGVRRTRDRAGPRRRHRPRARRDVARPQRAGVLGAVPAVPDRRTPPERIPDPERSASANAAAWT